MHSSTGRCFSKDRPRLPPPSWSWRAGGRSPASPASPRPVGCTPQPAGGLATANSWSYRSTPRLSAVRPGCRYPGPAPPVRPLVGPRQRRKHHRCRLRHRSWTVGPVGAKLAQVGRGLPPDVVDRNTVPGVQQAPRHRDCPWSRFRCIQRPSTVSVALSLSGVKFHAVSPASCFRENPIGEESPIIQVTVASKSLSVRAISLSCVLEEIVKGFWRLQVCCN